MMMMLMMVMIIMMMMMMILMTHKTIMIAMADIIIVEVNDDFTGQMLFLFKFFLPKLILNCLLMIAVMVYNYPLKGM